MKAFYLILCVCFAVFITVESKDEMKKYTEKLTNGAADYDACKNVSGVTIDYILNLNKTVEEFEAPDMEESRTKVGCFLSCLMQEKEAMNGTVISVQKIIDILKMQVDSSEEIPQENLDALKDVIQDCVKQVEHMTNVCSIGWKFGMCMGTKLGI